MAKAITVAVPAVQSQPRLFEAIGNVFDILVISTGTAKKTVQRVDQVVDILGNAAVQSAQWVDTKSRLALAEAEAQTTI